jgi:thiamine biosynthesis lipoprotein
VRGSRGDRPWRIGIRHPRGGNSGISMLASMIARDEAVNTHADDQRSFDHDGVRYGHILDPLLGRPARDLCSVTVVHPDGTLAEAGGAALYVAGRNGWRRLAHKLGLQQVMVVTADGEVQATGALAARIEPEGGTALRIAG